MLETRTRLKAAIPAFLRADSKLGNFSLCLPTPLVRKISLAIKTRSQSLQSLFPKETASTTKKVSR